MMKRVLGAVGVATVMAAGAVFSLPGAAEAAGWNSVSATVNSDGSWTYGTVKRHKTDYGPMKLDMQSTTSDEICVYLEDVNSGEQLGGSQCWNQGQTGIKQFTANSKPRTFIVVSAKGPAGSDRTWSGRLYY